jgi:hypothetical protein
MHHLSQTAFQHVALPDRLPRPPSKPPDERLIIKIPPRGIIVPEPWPPALPDEPEIDKPDEPTWPRPEMPPPHPADRPSVIDNGLV